MQLNAASFAPQVLKPQPTATPTVQAALTTAVAAAQQIAQPTRTQTLQAAQAPGKAENPRNPQTSAGQEQKLDTLANNLDARTNRAGYGQPRRGAMLDVSV